MLCQEKLYFGSETSFKPLGSVPKVLDPVKLFP